MTHSDEEGLLAAGAALDDLSRDEWRAYELHRRACTDCEALEADLGAVLADLALVAPERGAPAGGLERVFAAIGVGAPGPPAFELAAVTGRPARPTAATRTTTRPGTGPGGRVRPMVGVLALAASLAVVAVGLGVRSALLERDLDGAASRIAALERDLGSSSPVIALVAAPDHVITALHAEPVAPSASASVLYRPGTADAYVVAYGLPPTAAGRVYQLWVADATGVHALGTFSHDGDGPFVAPFGVDLGTSAAAMITLEPAGGAVGDPGPQVVFGEL